MDTDMTNDAVIAGRLRRLDAGAAADAAPFSYDGLMERQARRAARSRRRHRAARATAGALVIALVGASLWRLDQPVDMPRVAAVAQPETRASSQPRLVRADTYLAVAALEDHIATIDDALNDARLRAGGDEVARLERTRAELIHSYASVRYAEMVSANF
jgi:hypothetical protein